MSEKGKLGQGNEKNNYFVLQGDDVALFYHSVALNEMYVPENAQNIQASPSKETRIDTMQYTKPTMVAK